MFPQKSPVYAHKSPIFPQKSPIFPQKSLMFPQKSPIFPQKSPTFVVVVGGGVRECHSPSQRQQESRLFCENVGLFESALLLECRSLLRKYRSLLRKRCSGGS